MNGIPYWVANLSDRRKNALESGWKSPLATLQLANPWQRWKIGAHVLPGVWECDRLGRTVVTDDKKLSGGDGGPVVIRGLKNPEFTIVGRIYTPSQFAEWLKIAAEIDPGIEKRSRDQHLIENPLCSLSGVRSVIIIGVDYKPPREGDGLRIELKLRGVSERANTSARPKTPTARATKKSLPEVPFTRVAPVAKAPNLRDIVPPGSAR